MCEYFVYFTFVCSKHNNFVCDRLLFGTFHFHKDIYGD